MKKLLLIISAVFISSLATAQLENKGNIYLQLGFPVFEEATANPSESIFTGYNSVPYFGAYALYSFNSRLHAGGSLKILVTNKTNYSFSNTSFGAVFKYNILPVDRAISPFVLVEGNINYSYVSQTESTLTVTSIEQGEDEEIIVDQVEYEQPEIKVGVFPVLGAYASVGVEFTPGSANKNLGFFLSGDYYLNNVHTQDVIVEKFPNNVSEFSYWSISVGVRISFLRQKDLF